MKKRKVISFKNLPIKYPVIPTAIAYLYLDQYNAPGWVWGINIVAFSLLWIGAFLVKKYTKEVDITEPLSKRKDGTE